MKNNYQVLLTVFSIILLLVGFVTLSKSVDLAHDAQYEFIESAGGAVDSATAESVLNGYIAVNIAKGGILFLVGLLFLCLTIYRLAKDEKTYNLIRKRGEKMIYYLFMGIFIIITSIFVLKNSQIVYLLFKLGFNFDVIKFMVVELLMVALVITILDSFGYTTSSFVISSFILGMFLPAVYETTQKRKPSKIQQKEI